jgi:hypothetical protein
MKWGAVAFRRRDEEREPVSVNARLARLSSSDLLDLAESQLIMASRELLHARGTGKELALVDYYLDRANVAARMASDALQIVTSKPKLP